MISLLLHKTDWAEIITVENMEMLKKKQKKTFFFLGGGGHFPNKTSCQASAFL